MFTVGDADSCGANVEVAVLVVAASGLVGIEVELDVDGVGAASFSCCVVTLLVCSSRITSVAASWMVGSKVVTQCWISV